MTIYVDDMRLQAKVGQFNSRWSHLMSDLPGEAGTKELLAFAHKLGLRPGWIQHMGRTTEHFDVTDPKRLQALRLGAIPISYGHEGAALTHAKLSGTPFDLDTIRTQSHTA